MQRGSLSRYGAGKELLKLLDAGIKDEKLLDGVINATGKLVDEVSGEGKFDLVVLKDGLVLSNAKTGNLRLSSSSVTSVVILDNIPKDTKGRVLLLLALDKAAGLMHGKTKLEAVVLQLTASAELSVKLKRQGEGEGEGGGSGGGEEEEVTGPAPVVLCQLLGIAGIVDFISPNPDTFTSCKGAMAVGANFKVNDGLLFPLPAAFCFVERPPLFIPHASIRYVALARTSSATFDLLLHLTGGEVLEFGHLDKSELGRIQTYLTQARLALSEEEAANSEARAAGKAASGSGAGSSRPGALANGTDENDDDDSDSDDEDFDPEQPDSAEKPRPAKRSRTEDIGEDDDDDDEDEDEEDDEYETDDDEDGTADTGTPSRPSRGGEVAEDSDEGEDEDEDERGEEAGEADDDDDDSDVSVEDEDGICAANLTELIEKDKEEDKKAARQRAGKPGRT
ncbi:hypothetical protein V8C86DRAFT_3106498 [Haematococcus lacustris]